MIEKQELVKKLKMAALSEEALVALITKHLSIALNQSSLDGEVLGKLHYLMDILKEDSILHEAMLNSLVVSISNSDTNVY
ncbi:hypothetical protein G9409_09235 [Chlorobium sp. BLA1]|uniref:hypothetical protein n=1 Tax=Candidatus Chlorobium masyuteum TaxID=2716876 RepID=UPI001423A145|nr:hypothetical protein [Candidatus Chlorobium masyuteum]NHQ60761.1 hypothetical protein [Candidatus Chlorobium masyuteum]NTU45398.1 hypothetical protein [Chlorobiaceae bacterium]